MQLSLLVGRGETGDGADGYCCREGGGDGFVKHRTV
jgi:hypothetical protein